MRNLSHLGEIAAALAIAGATAVVRNSEADPSGGSRTRGLQEAKSSGKTEHIQPGEYIDASAPIQNAVRNGVGQLTLPMGAMGPDTDGQLGVLFYNAGVLTADRVTNEMRARSASLVLENIELRDKLADTRTQVDELLMRLEIMETTCEDAVSEDGCPAGCADQFCDGIFITSVGGNMF